MKLFCFFPLTFTLFLICSSITASENSKHINAVLDKYKDFIVKGTLDTDWSGVSRIPLSRYDTFKTAFEHVAKHNGKVVVELGTTRSFVHGGLPGCNLDDIGYWTPNNPENWDWGAGCFTRLAAECLSPLGIQIHTVDICQNHINRCRIITQDVNRTIQYYVASSVDFLASCNFPGGIDLLYIDTGDMTPIEPTAQLQLQEAMMIVKRNLLSPNGIILLDDVGNQTPRKFGETSSLGKSKYALPYLLNHGFEILQYEYQVILMRKK